jgi:hypothetical protein
MDRPKVRTTTKPLKTSKAIPRSEAGMPIAHSNVRDCRE